MTYNEMKTIAMQRAVDAGFGTGTKVQFKKQAGVIAGVNPFCHDFPNMPVYVDFEPKKGHHLPYRLQIGMNELTPQ